MSKYYHIPLLENDEHLERLVHTNKNYLVEKIVTKETYDKIITESYVTLGEYKGNLVYGYIKEKAYSPKMYPKDGIAEYYIIIWIMVNNKIEIKTPPEEE